MAAYTLNLGSWILSREVLLMVLNMHREEIIERTLAIMPYRHDRAIGGSDTDQTFDYDEIVISELVRRLPLNDDFKTCADFAHLNAGCCETCHAVYPHYDMYVQPLAAGGYAWICCRVRSALLGIEISFGPDDELVDLSEALRAAKTR